MIFNNSVNPLVLLFLGIVSFSIYLFFILDFMMVEGTSMYPELKEGDIIFINRFAYGFKLPFSSKVLFYWSKPDYNDIIVLRSSTNASSLVKRCFALENDILCKQNGVLRFQGQSIPLSCGQKISLKKQIKVPPNSVFVLGDNAEKSIDSRDFGAIPFSYIEGQVFFHLGCL